MSTESSEYTRKMIEAFIQKPEKVLWYQNAFDSFNINGIDKMKWRWSWWAFFGGFLFLLYRKQYTASLVVFLSSIVLGFIPFVALIISILTGGYATYFVYKGYKSKLNEVENVVAPEEESKRVETMRAIGGYHQWVPWVYGLFILSIIFVIGIAYITETLS